MATTDPEGQPRSLMLERDRRKKEYQGYVRRLRRMVPAGGRILDVGSGLGLFLELMGPEYHRQGIEINPAAARVTRERLGIPVWETDAGSVDFPPASLDLVAFMQTIDHLDQPGGMIERSAQWLKPGGILFLSALINVRSPMARLFGGDFRLLHPFHLAYFNPARFSRLVRRHGLKPVHREYPYFRTEWFTPRMAAGSLLKTAARAFGTRKEPSPPFYGNTFNLVAVKEGW
jgi:SAM-dependent methyltransferase